MKTWTLYLLIGLTLIGTAVLIDLSMSEKTVTPVPANQVSEILRQRTPRPLSDPMILPANYRDNFIHYATIDRIDGISRNLYINPAAIEALTKGDPIPERSQIIIEAYSVQHDEGGQFIRDENGRFIQDTLDPEIHSSEFRTSWQLADMHTTSRSGDWNFMAFDFESGEQIIKDLGGCFSCHEGAVRRDFVFTRPILLEYIQTGEIQYSYCPRPDRAICG